MKRERGWGGGLVKEEENLNGGCRDKEQGSDFSLFVVFYLAAAPILPPPVFPSSVLLAERRFSLSGILPFCFPFARLCPPEGSVHECGESAS